jgi:hypothetical protein
MPRLVPICVAVCLFGGAAPAAMAAKAPATWDGLVRVPAKRFDSVYIQPGADFRAYSKIMLDPTEVAYRKNWVRDYNSTVMGLSDRLSQAEADKILGNVRRGFEEIFREAYGQAGYQIVAEPGPDVLRVRTAVLNLYATAPVELAGRSRTYAREAGAGTLVIELRDSSSGALLGRAVDGKLAGDTGAFLRSNMTNRFDFRALFRDWAKISLQGLTTLRGRAPASGAAP